MLGEPEYGVNTTLPLSSPLFEILWLTVLVVPVEFVNLIQKGWPGELTSNVYWTPLTNVIFGFEPVAAPANKYALLASFVT